MQWIRKLLAAVRADTPSGRGLLKSYKPYNIPYVGPGSSLSLPQAQANLNFLLNHREERLAILGEVLIKKGVDVQKGLRDREVRGFLDQLYCWLVPTFRDLYNEELAAWDMWMKSHRSGNEIVFSLTMDVSIVIGEIIVRNKPAFQWALDQDRSNVDMMSYMRPVVLMPKQGSVLAPVVIDVEALVVEQYRKVPQRIFGTANELLSPVMLAISGAYESAYAPESR